MEDKGYIEDFLDYSKWLVVGWSLGLAIGMIFDYYYTFGDPVLEGTTRFIVGYGDTIGASLGIVLCRLKHKRKSKAETFWIGTAVGSLAGPLVHFAVLSMGLNPLGVAGAIYAIAYSNADNWGGIISSLVAELRRHRFSVALSELYKNKFVVANFFVLIFLALLAVSIRMCGLAPIGYFASAVEGLVLDNDSTLAILIFYIYVRRASKK